MVDDAVWGEWTRPQLCLTWGIWLNFFAFHREIKQIRFYFFMNVSYTSWFGILQDRADCFVRKAPVYGLSRYDLDKICYRVTNTTCGRRHLSQVMKDSLVCMGGMFLGSEYTQVHSSAIFKLHCVSSSVMMDIGNTIELKPMKYLQLLSDELPRLKYC